MGFFSTYKIWILAALVAALSGGIGYAWHVAYSRGAAQTQLRCNLWKKQFQLEKAAETRKAVEDTSTALNKFYKLRLNEAHQAQRRLAKSLMQLQAKREVSDECKKELDGRVPDCLVDYIDRVPAPKGR